MSRFSDLLNKIVEEMKANKYQLCKALKIDRTIFYRYLRAETLPDRDMVLKIAKELCLTPAATNELLDAFTIAECGDDVFEKRQIVKQLLLDLPDAIHKLSSSNTIKRSLSSVTESFPEIEILSGSVNINERIRGMFDCAINSNEETEALLLIQPDYFFVMQSLLSISINDRQKLTVKHAVRFQHVEKQSSKGRFYNLEFMKSIIPILFSSRQDNTDFYQVYYYYDNYVTKESRLMEIMPNLIIIGGYVLSISSDYSTAIFYSQQDVTKHFRLEFSKLLEHMQPLVIRMRNEFELVAFMYEIETQYSPVMFEIKKDPCILPLLTYALIDSKIKDSMPDKEMVKSMTKHRLDLYNEHISKGTKYSEFFTEEGLDEFIKTSFFSEIPQEYVLPLNNSEKLDILNRLKENIENNPNFDSLLIDNNRFKVYENDICIMLHNKKSLYLGTCGASNNLLNLIYITEKSIVDAFEDYFSVFHLEKSFVHDKCTTLKILQEKIEMLQNGTA